ncbi:MAG: AAA family ATPase [Bacteroides sp.]|nr:AAA family ATPase [Bacteroides sp.]
MFEMPLLRLGMGRLMGAYVEESEHNLAKAIAVAEAAQPCILWIDEIEKAFAGSGTDKNEGSDITVRRMVGSFLTWLQERKSEVYIAATANSLIGLPDELARKGRLDDTFYITYPNPQERKKIYEISLSKYNLKHNVTEQDLTDMTGNEPISHTGAEIDAIIQTACEKYFIN